MKNVINLLRKSWSWSSYNSKGKYYVVGLTFKNNDDYEVFDNLIKGGVSMDRTTTKSRQSVLKIFLEQLKDEIVDRLYYNKDTLDDITKAELNGRLSMIKEVQKVCEQRGRY